MEKTPRTMSLARIRFPLAFLAVLGLLSNLYATPGARAADALMPVIVNSTAVVVNTGGDPIRIRQGPGLGYARLAYAYEGQTVGVLDGPSTDASGYRWFEVLAPSGTGWMSAAFLQGTGSPLTGTALVSNTGSDPLRVRVAPDANSQILALLVPGTSVNINSGPVADAVGIAWYNITAQGITGWSMAQFLSQPAGQASQQVNPPPAPQATATPRPAPVQAPPPAAAPVQSTGNSRLDQYRAWMEEARAQYPYREGVSKMWSVMMCESSGNPNAVGGGYYRGLFQYAPSTWAGGWNPYRNNSIWDARSQIFATAKAWSIGMQGNWACY